MSTFASRVVQECLKKPVWPSVEATMNWAIHPYSGWFRNPEITSWGWLVVEIYHDLQGFNHQQVCHWYVSFICWEMTKNSVNCDTIWHSPQLTPGARVVPLAFLGGASGGDFGFPQQAFETPPWSLGFSGSSGLLVACWPVCCWRWIII